VNPPERIAALQQIRRTVRQGLGASLPFGHHRQALKETQTCCTNSTKLNVP
jgi:hypothetical protein